MFKTREMHSSLSFNDNHLKKALFIMIISRLFFSDIHEHWCEVSYSFQVTKVEINNS